MTTTLNTSDGLRELTVRQIFAHDTYRIPIYQRAYAWATAEIQTLLRDIRDARINSARENRRGYVREYYIGSLVVNAHHENGKTIYEVIDGQQRLTTLFVLLSIAPRLLKTQPSPWDEILQGKLEFEGREQSQEDLHRLARDGAEAIGLLTTDGIAHAAQLINTAATRASSPTADLADHNAEGIIALEDLQYLLDHVKVVRTELPPNTDLNHYFEVMNTRGEQLEKHEILKARMLHKLQARPEEQESFARIWDACAQLTRHIQLQFSTSSERDRIFGHEWDSFLPEDADALFDILQNAQQHNVRENAAHEDTPEHHVPGRVRLIDLLQAPGDFSDPSNRDAEEDPGSYTPIIDFPNFLLHVLKIQLREHFSWAEQEQEPDAGIRLEDKYLLEEFDKALQHADDAWVRDFAWLLLRSRYLLDTFVIRVQHGIADDDDENWVIHQGYKYTSRGNQRHLSARATFGSAAASAGEELEHSSAGRRVLMLQSMFQVTDTRRASKYFLFQILDWLNANAQNSRVDTESFAQYLERSAVERLRTINLRDTLHTGTHVPNFIFNFLDYVLWLRGATENSLLARMIDDEKVVRWSEKHSRNFHFRYRTSVEHFYPVQPDETQLHKALSQAEVNHFGNLCIMSRSENSARNNLMPKAKVAQYKSTDQSLKFQIMAETARELELRGQEWDPQNIRAHGDLMAQLLAQIAHSGLHADTLDESLN